MMSNGYTSSIRMGFKPQKIPKYGSGDVTVPLEMGSFFNCNENFLPYLPAFVSEFLHFANITLVICHRRLSFLNFNHWSFFVLLLKIGL